MFARLAHSLYPNEPYPKAQPNEQKRIAMGAEWRRIAYDPRGNGPQF